MKTIRIFLSLLLALTVLQGCGKSGGGGGSSSSTPANGAVRLVNATPAFASLDLTTPGATLAPAVAPGSASAYAGIAPGSYVFSLNLNGTGIPSAQQPLLISSGVNYALVTHTGAGQLQLTALTEIEAAPAAGDGKIRVSNLALQDTGSVDVYVTGDGILTNVSPLMTKLSGTSGYFEILKGTYHITVTGVGNKADLRLDLPSVVVNDQQVQTLILTSTAGGVLVDGWLVTQQALPLGAVIAQKNVSARVRVAANIAAHGSVAATANGVLLASLVSPSVGSYALVPAGALIILVNGAACNDAANPNAAAGADLTLLVVGTGALQCSVLNDDNRLPFSGTAKLRLVNGVNGVNVANGLPGNISLTADANLVAQNLAPGTASVAVPIATTGNISALQVKSQTNALLSSPLDDVTLQSQGVYSVFMLDDSPPPAPTVVEIVRADR